MDKKDGKVKQVRLGTFRSPSKAYHVHKINSSNFSEEAHYHNYYQIGYVECGVITHCQEGQKVNLVGGDAFIIPPRFVHSVIFNENAELYSLSFSPKIFSSSESRSSFYNFLRALNFNAGSQGKIDVRLNVTLNESHRKSIKSLFDCLLREFSSKSPQKLSASASLIASLLCILSQAYAVLPAIEVRSHQYGTYRENVIRCIKYIEENFSKPLTIDVLADQFAVSRSTLGLWFSRLTGMTVKAFINRKRIEHAAEMIRSSSFTITEIATMVGYEEFSTFYRNFTKVMGISSANYRRQIESLASEQESGEKRKKLGLVVE